MNAKICKRLRKEARALSVGMPEKSLVTLGTNTTTAVNYIKSTRGIYRFLKGARRKGSPQQLETARMQAATAKEKANANNTEN